ncbi:MAG: uridine kinase [Acholeplasmatales bacterium]|jgi:uridine kinase|nr:uridine kinase [Acholeplasmatales bacterium]
MNKPYIILVAGGSAGGKTTVVAEILAKLSNKDILVIKHDDYYKRRDDLNHEERKKLNYDHPSSLDNELLLTHLQALINGFAVQKPIYDFVLNNRKEEYETITGKEVIIIEGILTLENEKLRELADLKIFVDSDDDTRLIRRIKRDIEERGRDLARVIEQYLKTVKPMYHKYIRPSKRYADIIILNDIKHQAAVELVAGHIKNHLGEQHE